MCFVADMPMIFEKDKNGGDACAYQDHEYNQSFHRLWFRVVFEIVSIKNVLELREKLKKRV